MRTIFLTVCVLALLAGYAWTDDTESPAVAKTSEQKTGLLDMEYLFQNYKKFQVLRGDLKNAVTAKSRDGSRMANIIKALQNELAKLPKDSPNRIKHEEEVTRLTRELEDFRKKQQRHFALQESEIYKTVYLEISDAVRQHATANGYTLVMRFSRKKLEQSANPQEVLKFVNRNVVYHQEGDDISDALLKTLNDRYAE